MANNFKTPPILEQYDNYENWEKALKLWRLATDVPKNKQGTAVLLKLSGKARDKVLELEIEKIDCDAGLDNILVELAKIYKKDTIDAAYESFERFIGFKRDTSMNISEYIMEFEKRYHKAKTHGFTLASTCLGYFLLNQARLNEDHKKLVRATITTLEFEEVQTKLRKVFGIGECADSLENARVKIEDVNIAEGDVLYGNYNSNRGFRHNNSNFQHNRNPSFNQQRRFPGQNNANGSFTTSYGGSGARSKICSSTGKRKLRCNICESINHLSYNCPDKKIYAAEGGYESEEDYDVVLYQSNLITEADYQTFVAEAATSAILDSGAPANVAGKIWFESYVSGLTDKQQKSVKYFDSSSTFRFGSGQVYKSLYRAEIPVRIGKDNALISTDVVETTIPLLFSKGAMKKAGTSIDFVKDEVTMFGKKQNVNITESGHYAIPLNNSELLVG